MANNSFELCIPCFSENEAFARTVAAAFITPLDPTLEELSDIKTAISEAVTNVIVHAYPEGGGVFFLYGEIRGNTAVFRVEDEGVGIENVEEAMQPFFTTGDGARSGMGFSIMRSFMDELQVDSAPGKGTRVTLTKKISEK